MKKVQVIVKLVLILSINLYAPSLRHLKHKGLLPKVVDKKLDLSKFSITDIEGIETYDDIDQVEELNFDDNNIKNIEALRNIKENKIKVFSIISNYVKDLLPILCCSGLKRLYVHGNKFDSDGLSTLKSSLSNLEYVDVDDDEIKKTVADQKAAMEKEQEEDEKISNEQSSNQDSDSYKEEVNCTICMSPGPKTATPCMHLFHLACLMKWLKTDKERNQKESCPNCKTDLKDFMERLGD